MDDIKWVDPPESDTAGRWGVMARFVDALKLRPGTWAQYQPHRGHSKTGAANIKRGYPGVDATLRPRPDGKFDVYARGVGNGNGDTP